MIMMLYTVQLSQYFMHKPKNIGKLQQASQMNLELKIALLAMKLISF